MRTYTHLCPGAIVTKEFSLLQYASCCPVLLRSSGFLLLSISTTDSSDYPSQNGWKKKRSRWLIAGRARRSTGGGHRSSHYASGEEGFRATTRVRPMDRRTRNLLVQRYRPVETCRFVIFWAAFRRQLLWPRDWLSIHSQGLIVNLLSAGMHKHFRMVAISQNLRNHGYTTPRDDHTRIPYIWEKLGNLYNLEALDERVGLLLPPAVPHRRRKGLKYDTRKISWSNKL